MGIGDPAGGRPRIEIDMALLEELAKIQCTEVECAAVLRVSIDTIERAVKEAGFSSFPEFIKAHSADGKTSLRRAQMKLALDGNATMLIWMGKQHLGQRDKSDVDNNHGVTDQFAELLAHVAAGSKRIGS